MGKDQRSNRRKALPSNRSTQWKKNYTQYFFFLNEIRPFCDGKGRTCKIMFANDDEIIKLIDEKKKIFIV